MTTIRPADVLIVGAGSAGIPAAIFAARSGARVVQIEADSRIGGTLFLSGGQISAAGTKLQKKIGISDSPAAHFEDALRITNGSFDHRLTKLAIEEAAETFDWLMDLGYRPLPETPAHTFHHEPFRTRRYYWSENGAADILDVMRPVHEALVADGKITLRLSTRMVGILQDEKGAVIGVEVEGRGGSQNLFGKNVVLACGGFAANPDLWRELMPNVTLRSRCSPFSRGDGIRAALDLGAVVDGARHFNCSFSGVLEDPDDPLSVEFLNTNPNLRKPWEIFVDTKGNRFMREDHPSIDYCEKSLLAQPDMSMHIVFDEGIRQNAPLITTSTTEQDLPSKLGSHPHFLKAGSAADLAKDLGVTPSALEATISRYNKAVDRQYDDEFGREFLVRPINTPPYYAIKAAGVTVMASAGLVVDEKLRVVTADGSAIPNLYAAGEILGFARLSGNAFVGGMSLMPALTFGRLLGQTLLRR